MQTTNPPPGIFEDFANPRTLEGRVDKSGFLPVLNHFNGEDFPSPRQKTPDIHSVKSVKTNP